MQKTTVRITEFDIQENERFRLNNPIVFVLQRMTGTLWQLDDNGFLFEAMKPFRSCLLSQRVMDIFREYRGTGKMEPCEFEVDFRLDAPDADREGKNLSFNERSGEIGEKRRARVTADRF